MYPNSEGTRSVLGGLQWEHLEHSHWATRHPPPIVCMASCQVPPTPTCPPPNCLLNTSSLLEQDVGCTFKTMKPNLSEAKQLEEGAPRAFCHSAISDMQIAWLSNPVSRKTHYNDTLGKEVRVFGTFAFPRPNHLYLRYSFPSGKNTHCAPPSYNVHRRHHAV